MYENKKQKLAPERIYYRRIGTNALLASLVLLACLLIGVVGYYTTVPCYGWYDSLLNASMILSGMGPISPSYCPDLPNKAKLFASAYALFSGITFLTTFGVLIAPVIHRFFHKLHLENDSND
jgi:hypothetical protein